MKYLKKYKIFERLNLSTLYQDIIGDIKQILLPFSDDNLQLTIECVEEDEIEITIATPHPQSSNKGFILDEEKSDALIRMRTITESEWDYSAVWGSMASVYKDSFYIHTDDRGIRSGSSLSLLRILNPTRNAHDLKILWLHDRITWPIYYIQIFLTKK